MKTALDGQIDVQFFSNARLFRDADVIRALGRGAVEMAVPGTWHVTRYVPDVGVFQLPVFYGRRAQDIYSILDSPLGKNLNARIEKTLNFKVIGGWIDLGYAHLFGIRQQIRQHEDIEGLKVRDDKGYWQQMETYIHEHSDAQFSHSICRECAEKFYPDLDIYEDENN